MSLSVSVSLLHSARMRFNTLVDWKCTRTLCTRTENTSVLLSEQTTRLIEPEQEHSRQLFRYNNSKNNETVLILSMSKLYSHYQAVRIKWVQPNVLDDSRQTEGQKQRPRAKLAEDSDLSCSLYSVQAFKGKASLSPDSLICCFCLGNNNLQGNLLPLCRHVRVLSATLQPRHSIQICFNDLSTYTIWYKQRYIYGFSPAGIDPGYLLDRQGWISTQTTVDPDPVELENREQSEVPKQDLVFCLTVCTKQKPSFFLQVHHCQRSEGDT